MLNTLYSKIIGLLRFKILPDGKVWIKQGKWSWSQLSPGTFCLDGGINFEEDENSTFSFSGSGDDTVLVDCTDRVENNEACHSVWVLLMERRMR